MSHDDEHHINDDEVAGIAHMIVDTAVENAAIGARQERDRIERLLYDHAEHASEKVYQSRVQVAEREIIALRTRLQVLEVKHNTVEGDLEHRIVVLEGRMENVLARLDGLTLGMVTLSLDDPSREKLKALLRGRSIVPDEEGTSRS